MAWAFWQTLACNAVLLIVSSVLVADVSMSEETVLLVLTGLTVVLL
jgi:hypothetical protein